MSKSGFKYCLSILGINLLNSPKKSMISNKNTPTIPPIQVDLLHFSGGERGCFEPTSTISHHLELPKLQLSTFGCGFWCWCRLWFWKTTRKNAGRETGKMAVVFLKANYNNIPILLDNWQCSLLWGLGKERLFGIIFWEGDSCRFLGFTAMNLFGFFFDHFWHGFSKA